MNCAVKLGNNSVGQNFSVDHVKVIFKQRLEGIV